MTAQGRDASKSGDDGPQGEQLDWCGNGTVKCSVLPLLSFPGLEFTGVEKIGQKF